MLIRSKIVYRKGERLTGLETGGGLETSGSRIGS
jgi:hypothetical protein